jgi:preprotein translocase subunit SecY
MANTKLGAGLTSGGLTELRQRLLFVLLGILVFRIGSYIPIPGIDASKLAQLFSHHTNGILGMFNVFSGGSLKRMTIFALSIMPYISSSIIVQMYSSVSPQMAQLKKEGEAGRRKINQYTRIGTLILACLQGSVIAKWLVSSNAVLNPSLQFYVVAILSLVTGTMFLMWMGEQMTERGVGNGISLIIFSGIVARFPSALGSLHQQIVDNGHSITMLLLFAVIITVTTVVVYFERAQRRIKINYANRQKGNYGAQAAHFPLKINMSGVIPPIFAQSILLFFTSVPSFLHLTAGNGFMSRIFLALSPGQPGYMLLYAVLVIFFAFFYTSLTFDPNDTAKNLKQSGAFIAGIRPGEQTAKYIDQVMTRLTLTGSIYLALVALLPQFLIMFFQVPFYFGGTSLLIVVVVLMDFMAQVQTHLMSNKYANLMKKTSDRKQGSGLVRGKR